MDTTLSKLNEETSGTALTSRLGSLPSGERDSILRGSIARYGQGESVYAIAKELGIEHTTLYRHLVKHHEADWLEARKSRALAELEESEEDLKTASNALALTRARERVKSAQWQLERVYRRIYGQEQATNAAAQVAIQINLRREEKPLESVEATVLAAK